MGLPPAVYFLHSSHPSYRGYDNPVSIDPLRNRFNAGLPTCHAPTIASALPPWSSLENENRISPNLSPNHPKVVSTHRRQASHTDGTGRPTSGRVALRPGTAPIPGTGPASLPTGDRLDGDGITAWAKRNAK